MWRKADKDPNKYLVVGNMIMDKTSNKGMSVEVIHDEDIKDKIAEGKIPLGNIIILPFNDSLYKYTYTYKLTIMTCLNSQKPK